MAINMCWPNSITSGLTRFFNRLCGMHLRPVVPPGGLELIPNSMGRYQNNPAYPDAPALQNHPEYPATGYCDDAYAFAALDFVRQQGQNYNATGQPFFGLLAVQIPHAPFDEITELPDWNKAYADDPHFASLSAQSRQWAAMVTRIDAHFGNLMAALEDPNQDGDPADSIADNTLIIFQSDNGGPGGPCIAQLGANGGLRGTKGQIQEGGIRVPLIMRWPAKINQQSELQAGTTSDRVVDVTDLLPTFCELAGTTVPLGIDGVSIAPTLSGSGDQRKREFIIHEAGNGQSIIRGNYKLIRSPRSALELYDLESDQAEANNIAADHPELVKELETLLLGERVDEPRGFANTYHRWTGADDAVTSSADHWSDYVYSNAGVTYMTDAGSPQLSWTAQIKNTGDQPNTARADADLEFLGLQIEGNPATDCSQSLMLGPGISLTGRNEIRIGKHGVLTIAGGTVSSLRWVDVQSGGTLNGNGSVNATVYNDGTVSVEGIRAELKIGGDYRQSPDAELAVGLTPYPASSLEVAGAVSLAGTLSIAQPVGFESAPGTRHTIVSAERIDGQFTNPGNVVVSSDGTGYQIHYSDSAVSIVTIRSATGE